MAELTISVEDLPSAHVAGPPPKTARKRVRNDTPKAPKVPKITKGPQTAAKPAPKKRGKDLTLGFYVVCEPGKAVGVICADTRKTATDILQAEMQKGNVAITSVNLDTLVSLSMDQEFCYPISFGPPEQMPERGTAAISGTPSLFLCQDFDCVPGYRGTALVVARDEAHAVQLTNAYLMDLGFKDYDAQNYNVGEVPKAEGYSFF